MTQKLLLLSFSFLLVLAFQNCGMSSVDFELSSAYVCDPFALTSGSSGCGGQGLKGKIFFFDIDRINNKALGENKDFPCTTVVDWMEVPLCDGMKTQDYPQFGKKQKLGVILSRIDVPPQSFDLGFPKGNGEFLEDSKGQKLVEYFGLDLVGFLTNPTQFSTSEGNLFELENQVQLASVSDDGFILDIEGENYITDDSIHGPRWNCSEKFVKFDTKAQKKKLHLTYYQGPKVHIAMQLYYRPASKAHLPCSEEGGFLIVPSAALSY